MINYIHIIKKLFIPIFIIFITSFIISELTHQYFIINSKKQGTMNFNTFMHYKNFKDNKLKKLDETNFQFYNFINEKGTVVLATFLNEFSKEIASGRICPEITSKDKNSIMLIAESNKFKFLPLVNFKIVIVHNNEDKINECKKNILKNFDEFNSENILSGSRKMIFLDRNDVTEHRPITIFKLTLIYFIIFSSLYTFYLYFFSKKGKRNFFPKKKII